MASDQRDIDFAGDHGGEGWICLGGTEAVELSVLEIRDARREAVTEKAAQGEDMVADAAAVGVVDPRPGAVTGAIQVQQAVQHMDGLAGGGGDRFGMEGSEPVGDVGVELDR